MMRQLLLTVGFCIVIFFPQITKARFADALAPSSTHGPTAVFSNFSGNDISYVTSVFSLTKNKNRDQHYWSNSCDWNCAAATVNGERLFLIGDSQTGIDEDKILMIKVTVLDSFCFRSTDYDYEIKN